MYNISPDLLWGIAKYESNFHPGAINYNENGTYDFGLMQINSSWYRTIGKANWRALADPCYNVKVASWILSRCIGKYGYTWDAVGCYNARSKSKRDRYAHNIYAILKRHNLLLARKDGSSIYK